MKILLDALQAGNESGTGTYAYALSRYLPRAMPEAEISVICPQDMADRFENLGLKSVAPSSTARAPFGTIARSLQMGRAVRRLRPDIVHYPASFKRIADRNRTVRRTVVTVHDLSFIRHPEWFKTRRVVYYRTAIGPTVRSADLLLADSEATANDLRQLLGVPESKIIVTHLGVDERFAPAGAESIARLRERIHLPDRFFLYLGTIEPRKNLPRVIRAFDTIADHCDLDLVIAGREGWRTGETKDAFARSHSRSRIHFPGFVSSEDVPALLSAADTFVWPSLWEGFGLPPLEAMACGTPVITSSTSSLPEVVADAAVTVDPENTGAIADAMRTLANDASMCARLREAGIARARQFSWHRTAELTAQAYRRVMGA